MEQVGMTDAEATAQFSAMFAPQPPQGTEQPEPEDVIDGDAEVEASEQDLEFSDEFEATEAEGESDAEADGEEPETYTVRVDGQETEVALPELIAGYQRQSDYTRKTQALAGQRRDLEVEIQQMRQERDQYSAALPQLEQIIQMGLGVEPREEQYNSRADYLYAKDQYVVQQQQLHAVQAERQRVAQQQQQEQALVIQRWREAQAQELQSKLPEWADSKVMESDQATIRDYALSLGFSPEELSQVYDHRFVMVLRDAARFKDLQTTGKRKAQKAKTKAMPPGSGDSGVRGRADKQLRERAKSGKVEDIAPLMGQLLTQGR